ncbi:acrylate utilization transcriptional regulator AcuR [Sneathiella glossodoripedis]|uniref:acrylate utilization transcriptional regulator AcuR n=1 Tax=Sneathiella glossodoripedis TaxID=418853 RepID=UPI00046F30F3|nr:TetR/AcrR family transcriptional regulator [Sneathiella glossodoripedis]
MTTNQTIKRKRGRPPKLAENRLETRERLIRSGMSLLTEKGFISTGLTELLSDTGIPKGSFYHYFESKEEFGHEVLKRYGQYFENLLDKYLTDEAELPLARIDNFIKGATDWIEKHRFTRGCLVGNLGQEASGLNKDFCERLENIFQSWQARIATCLEQAKEQNQLSPDIQSEQMAAFFWIGWEGAILRSKLVKSRAPLLLFREVFFSQITQNKNH